MKRSTYLLFVALMTAATAHSQAQLDLGAAMLASGKEINGDAPAKAPSAAGRPVGLLVSVADDDAVARIEATGAIIKGVSNNVAIVSAPASIINDIAAQEGVISITASRRATPSLYHARITSNANGAIDGTAEGFTMPYTGKGVVTGLMDIGIDPNHPNFLNADTTATRVKAVYQFTSGDGDFTAYTTPEEIAGFTTDDKTEYHGTHTAGIMAGGYRLNAAYGLDGESVNDSPMPFYGVAVDADIVMCCGELYDENIAAAVEKVIEYGESVGKPPVVNLSLGTVVGPHDGTSAICRYLEPLGERGVICMASGNDGGSNCAVTYTFEGDNDSFITAMSPVSSGAYAEFWCSDRQKVEVELLVYDKETASVLETFDVEALGKMLMVRSSNDNIFKTAFGPYGNIEVYTMIWPDNHRYVIDANFNITPTDDRYVAALRFSGPDGVTVNGYCTGAQFSNAGVADWVDGSGDGSVSDMCTGKNVISVGAYTSSTYSTMMTGRTHSFSMYSPVDDPCLFSSYGPTFDGRHLPDVCAPGSSIVSSESSYCIGQTPNVDYLCAEVDHAGRRYFWGMEQGTSMASPFVAGTAALMLEAAPSLTPSEVKDIIMRTAVPAPASSTPKQRLQWGGGKLDVVNAVREAIESSSVTGSPVEEPVVMIQPDGDVYTVYVPNAKSCTARIYAPDGHLAKSFQADDSEISVDLSTLSKGLYIMSIDSPGMHYTHKVIH